MEAGAEVQEQPQPRVRQLRADVAAKTEEAAAFFAALTLAEAATKTEIGWTVAATVAHLAIATDFTAGVIAKVRAGKERNVSDRVIHALNFVTARANARKPVAASVIQLRAAIDHALRQLDTLTDSDLDRPHQAPFRGETTFGVRLQDSLIGHFDQHMEQVRRVLASHETADSQPKEHDVIFDYRGGMALITGASSGIGEAFARELASRGMSVALVARSEDKLQTLAAALVRNHGIRAEVITADMSRSGAAQAVFAETQARDLRVHLLVNNAGFATYGPFDTLDPARDHEEVLVNVAAVVDMAHAFLPQMIARGAGGIINVASTAAFQPVPYMAVYGASKAFVLSFSEALWAENRARGVRVLALCPGNTATPFFGVVDASEPQVGPADTPEHVVVVALKGLERGRSSIISGPNAFNALLAQAPRFSPRPLVARIGERTFRPRTAHSTTKTARVNEETTTR